MTRNRLTGLLLIAVGSLACHHDDAAADPPFSETELSVKLSPASAIGRGWYASSDIPIEFDAKAVGISIYVEGQGDLSASPLMLVTTLKAPSGALLLDPSKLGQEQQNGFFPHRPVFATNAASADASVTIGWPMVDGATFERGTYILRVAGQVDSAKVRVVTRRNEKTDSGTLDVNLFYVTGSGVSTKADAAVRKAVDRFFDVYGAIGIRRGEIAAFDIDDASLASLSAENTAADSGMAKLMQHAGSAPNHRATNLFFVRELTWSNSSDLVLLGHSTGIPAALGMGESLHSGVAFSLSGFATEGGAIDTEMLGNVMAHETGHSMGLLHTTEGDLKPYLRHDLILDTPECPAGADTNGDEVLDDTECLPYDAQNIMFWLADRQTEFSPGQGEVLRQSVIVRGESVK